MIVNAGTGMSYGMRMLVFRSPEVLGGTFMIRHGYVESVAAPVARAATRGVST